MKDFWNERYSEQEFIYGESPNEYLKEKLKTIPSAKILFACEGEGRNVVFAAQSGWEVSAFDQSEMGKQKAELLAQKNNVQIEYIASDLDNISYPEQSFDALALIYAHFHSDTRKKYHQKLASYLKKDGILIIEAFNSQQIENQRQNPNTGGPRDVEMLYDLEEILSDFEGFELIEACGTMTELNEGNYHTGKASVIRIFAIKKQ